MRPSLRFLGLAIAGWAGVRAYSTGALPAGSLRLIEPSEAKSTPPLMATQFPPIEPAELEPMEDPGAYPPAYAHDYRYDPMRAMPVPMGPVVVPVYYGVQSVSVPLPPPRPAPLAYLAPEPAAAFYPNLPPLPDSLSQLASMSLGERQSRVVVPGQSVPAASCWPRTTK